MSITKYSIKNPYLIYILAAAVLFGGIYGFFFTKTDLFPDTVPPQVAVLTVQPGASAKDISNNITQILERELKIIPGIKRITSTTRDEVSSILLEFYYYKDLPVATAETTNALNRIKSKLPKTANDPQVFEIDSTNKPVMTLSVYPKSENIHSMRDVRLLAENDLKDKLLNTAGVSDIDIFGGYLSEIIIALDKDKLIAYNVSATEIYNKIIQENINIPAGYIQSAANEFIIKTDNSFDSLDKIENIIITAYPNNLKIKDIATIKYSNKPNRSFYHGNAKKSIAINILRDETFGTVDVINNVKSKIEQLKNEYRHLQFELTANDELIINVNIKGMNSSLISAIIMTVIIIFLFLGDYKASAVIGISIPLSFLATFWMLNNSVWTLNMVTLSGLIIAVGMVVDASIVTLENTHRLFKEENYDVNKAVVEGTDQVSFAILGGMLTTIAVLIPIMFVGGYAQQVLRPLTVTISVTLIASWLAAITIVPLLLKKAFVKEKSGRVKKIVEKWNDIILTRIEEFYIKVYNKLSKRRILTLIALLIFTMIIIRVTIMNVGRALMPDMDTGILNISFELPPSSTIDQVENTVGRIEKLLYENKNIVTISSVAGSEPGQMSFGRGGQTAQQGNIQVTLTPRNARKETIWQIMNDWRAELEKFPEFINFTIMEYGATPVSTTKAPIDIIFSGDDDKILNLYADKLIDSLKGEKGITDLRKSWYNIKREYNFKPDNLKLKYFDLTPKIIADYIKYSVDGNYIGNFKLNRYLDIPVRLTLDAQNSMNYPENILELDAQTKYGNIKLRSLGVIEYETNKTLFTRENLQNTLDVLANNNVLRISQATDKVIKKIENIKTELPDGYDIKISGSMADMNETNRGVLKALIIGLVILYLLLVVMFKSWTDPLTIISIVPYSLAGAFFGMLVFNKPMCMPAMMGIILLNGTIVNNAIIILTFIKELRAKNIDRNTAVIQTIKLRMRPILMTTVSTVIGLIPLIFEWAVGLERMSPLGIAAASGLIIGTFLTIVITPMVYTLVDDLRNHKKNDS